MSQEPSPSSWWRRSLRVGLLSFLLAVVVSWISESALNRSPALIAALVVLFLITLGVVFDVIGTSVTAAEATPINAMAAKRISGAKQALWLVRNADKVANFCNDVVGDVTGAVAGAAGTTVALKITDLFHGGTRAESVVSLVVIGLIAALNVGGRAAGKGYAIQHATIVVSYAGRALHGFERLTGRSVTGGRNANSSRRRTP